MSKELEPWEQCPNIWSNEKQYFNWIRGAMRKAWCRHPVKISYMHLHRFKAPLGKKTFKNPEGTMIWATVCETCNKVKKEGETEVDHKVRAGGCKSWDEFNIWIRSLLHINHNSLAIICKPCHHIKSYAEQHDMTFDEAKLAKKVIAFMKQSAGLQTLWLSSRGYRDGDIANEKARKLSYANYLKGFDCKGKCKRRCGTCTTRSKQMKDEED